VYLRNAIWEDHKTHRFKVLLSNSPTHFIIQITMRDCLTEWRKRLDQVSETELLLEVEEFKVLYVHVTVHRNKFLYSKTN